MDAIRIVLLLFCLAPFAGCDRHSRSPATAPTGTSSRVQSQLPASRPKASVLTIGARQYPFPAARLSVAGVEPAVTLALFSDDPAPEARRTNRYHFNLETEVEDLEKLDGAELALKAATADPEDSADGIFLDDDQIRLQPYDVTIRFAKSGPVVRVVIRGVFLRFSGLEGATAEGKVEVDGVLEAVPEAK
jgi:hypothetical protein